MRALLCLSFMLPLLAACSGPEGVSPPSLERRGYELSEADIERLLSGEVEVTDPAPVEAEPLPPALADAVERALADHLKGQAGFEEKFPATESAVDSAAGAALESEVWIAAHVRISRLDAARAPSIAAIGALDALYVRTLDERGLAYAKSIDAARDAVAEDVAFQSRVIETLDGALAR